MADKSISKDGELSLVVFVADQNVLINPVQYSFYTIILVTGGSGVFKADFGAFNFEAPAILFSTPLQTLQLLGNFAGITMLQFHGDYYCIEYHKQEVACNGVLFNNIYTQPVISLRNEETAFFATVIKDLNTELSQAPPADAVVTAYLQLLLAKATTIKMRSMESTSMLSERDEQMEAFRNLIDENFIRLRKPADYADLLHLSPDTLAKRCKQYFKKTPSELIQERIVLEAKKSLHLSRKSIKEIAHALNFADEHYFSRFFKKVTKISPQAFRLKTGISIVADLSTPNPE